MKCDVIVAGVGGQGVIVIARAIAEAAFDRGLQVKQGELHGMSQRGGAVHSTVRLSDEPVRSQLISAGSGHVLIGLDPVEAVRQLGMLAPEGWVIANSRGRADAGPEVEEAVAVLRARPNTMLIDADALARQAGSRDVSNTVLLGLAGAWLPVDDACLLRALCAILGPVAPRWVPTNRAAFEAGRAARP